MRTARGFTLTELVAVMLIVAILAVVATSVFDRREFDAAGYADDVRAQLAYAQKVAVAARRNVTVSVTGNTVAVQMCADLACTTMVDVASPQGEAPFVRAAPSNVTIGPDTVLTFNAQGAPSASASLVVNGGVIHIVTVEAGTGYVH